MVKNDHFLWIFSSFLLAHTCFHASTLLSLSQYFCAINLRSGVVRAPTVFFLLRIAFAICIFCVYIWILELSFLVLWRMYLWDCIWICRLITFANTAILTHSVVLEHGRSFCFVVSSSVSFSGVLKFSLQRSFTSLVKLISVPACSFSKCRVDYSHGIIISKEVTE